MSRSSVQEAGQGEGALFPDADREAQRGKRPLQGQQVNWSKLVSQAFIALTKHLA